MDRFEVAVHNSTLATTAQLSSLISTGTEVEVPEFDPEVLKVFASALPANTIIVRETAMAKTRTN
jgi:hypothetical protein